MLGHGPGCRYQAVPNILVARALPPLRVWSRLGEESTREHYVQTDLRGVSAAEPASAALTPAAK